MMSAIARLQPTTSTLRLARRIAVLCATKEDVRGISAKQRRAVRAEHARVIVNDLHVCLGAPLRQVSAQSKRADANRYALTR